MLKFATKSQRRFAASLILSAAVVSTSVGQNVPQLGAPPAPVKAKPGAYTLSGIYTLAGKGDKADKKTFSSDTKDVSAIYVKAGGDLILTDSVVTSTGDSSSIENSSNFGLNAAVLSARSKIKMTGGSVTTAGAGANAVYSTGTGSSITLSKTTISATGEGAHGVIASAGGTITLADLDIATSGAQASAVATDKGGGTITVTGGTITTAGEKSPVIFSTGTIKVTGATMTATGAEAAAIEGKGSITLVDTKLESQKSRGVLIYQSAATKVAAETGTFNMKGGSILATDGPLFFVTNATASIVVSRVNLNASSGTLIKAGPDEWGTAGSNGGVVNFTADHESLNGDLLAESPSAIVVKLTNETTWTGSAKEAAIALDSSSIWTLSGDSTVTVLADAQGAPNASFTNIVGNGHDARYDASLSGNAWLGGKTYKLANGGRLRPTEGTVAKNNNPSGNGPGNNNGYGGYGHGYGGGGGGHR
jgi:hypothetical protein